MSGRGRSGSPVSAGAAVSDAGPSGFVTRRDRYAVLDLIAGMHDDELARFDAVQHLRHQAAILGQDSAYHRRFRTETRDWNLGFQGGRYTRARKAWRRSWAKVEWGMLDYAGVVGTGSRCLGGSAHARRALTAGNCICSRRSCIKSELSSSSTASNGTGASF